jgi:hypothetical protein
MVSMAATLGSGRYGRVGRMLRRDGGRKLSVLVSSREEFMYLAGPKRCRCRTVGTMWTGTGGSGAGAADDTKPDRQSHGHPDTDRQPLPNIPLSHATLAIWPSPSTGHGRASLGAASPREPRRRGFLRWRAVQPHTSKTHRG